MNKMVDKLIGNYRIKLLLGHGAFSEVYLAQHILLTNRIVAIKFLSPSFDKKRHEQACVLERLRQPHFLSSTLKWLVAANWPGMPASSFLF